jgi:uncharacterized lipoprotein YajG
LKSLTLSVVLLAAACLLAACSAPSSNTTTNTVANTTANAANTVANTAANIAPPTSTSTASASLSDPKSSIAYQFEQVKAGDVEKLKACLTPRVRDGVTKEVVDKAKVDSAQYTIDDLYASAEMGEFEGKKTAKVKMKNGRTLTTLIQTDGKWLADTIWFK